MRLPTIIGLLLLGLASAGNIHAAPDAIHEQGFVSIGGIEQWITIKGANSDNPVVLFLHGGPGNAMSAYADSMYLGWENDFTLVQWDQRGAGKTYGRTGPSLASSSHAGPHDERRHRSRRVSDPASAAAAHRAGRATPGDLCWA